LCRWSRQQPGCRSPEAWHGLELAIGAQPATIRRQIGGDHFGPEVDAAVDERNGPPCETTWQFVTASCAEIATAEPWDDGTFDACPSTV